MGSDLECAVCYRTFNAARRCPRELRCRHSFCESCLLALSRGAGPEGPEEAPRTITCPLCRSTTSISGGSQVRAELRVDEAVLERLMSAGVLDREEEEEEEEEEKQRRLPDTPAEESAPFPGTRGGRLRRSWRKVFSCVFTFSRLCGQRGHPCPGHDVLPHVLNSAASPDLCPGEDRCLQSDSQPAAAAEEKVLEMSLRWRVLLSPHRPPGALVLAAVLPLLAIPAGAQTGIFRGAPSQRVSTSPSGLLGSPEDGSSYSGALVAAGMRAGSAGGLPRGRPGYDGRHAGGMVRKTSRLWPAPHTDGGKVQNSLSYWENWQQTPGVKETDELRPDDGMKKSRFWGQAAPPGPPVGMDRPYRRSEIPRGQSYLFKPSRNPAVTGKPVGSVLNISREQQGGSQTSAHPAPAAEDQYGASSQGSAVSSAVSGSTLVPKPAQTPKRLYGYRGFEHPTRSRAEENSGRPGSDKGRFKMSNVYPALLAKYHFSQRDFGAKWDENGLKMGSKAAGSAETKGGITPESRERNQATTAVDSRGPPRNLGTTGSQTESGAGPRPPIKSDKMVPRRPGLESFTYTGLLGSVSFSRVGANLRGPDPGDRKVRRTRRPGRATVHLG